MPALLSLCKSVRGQLVKMLITGRAHYCQLIMILLRHIHLWNKTTTQNTHAYKNEKKIACITHLSNLSFAKHLTVLILKVLKIYTVSEINVLCHVWSVRGRILHVSNHIATCARNCETPFKLFPLYKMKEADTTIRKMKESYFIDLFKPKLNRMFWIWT